MFIYIYCRHKHADAAKSPASLKTHDVQALAGREIPLCEDCTRLLAHAFTKRTHCPMDPKPACKHCPSHCYHPAYRAQIREVMKYSGKKLLLSGRLDYLFRLLFYLDDLGGAEIPNRIPRLTSDHDGSYPMPFRGTK